MARYDPSTALLVVDVQNDFTDPDGSLAVPGGERVVPVIDREIRDAVAAGATVVYTQDWHPPVTPHFRSSGGIWPDHCVAGTWGAEFHPDLDVRGEIVRKGVDGGDGYSAFSVRDPDTGQTAATALGSLLQRRGVDRIVVVGLATDYCVVETVLDARRLGLDVEVLADAVRAVDLRPGDGDAAIARMREAGAAVT
ncbi:MAG TPA: isochorismatase family protein [Actinomycetota bacterium]|nr:isochorismatase family protein [Actinomycetota bacterium]